MKKLCYKCKLEKIENDFSSSQFVSKNGICRLCKKEYDSLRYKKDNIVINQKTKNYRNNNKDKVKEFKKNYQLNNKEIFQNNLRRFRKKNRFDPFRRIRNSISSNISHLLKKKGGSKNGASVNNYLPYSIIELIAHLEQQFESWMTWNNYGSYNSKTWDDNDSSTWTWQLDHIIPQSDLPYTSMEDNNFKKCWELSNLRPLSAKQNLIDGVNRERHQGDIR